MSEREQGRVKKWFDERGFGFIRTDAGDDLFFHASSLGFLSPEVGARVAFERGSNPRTNKPEAKNVSILDDAQASVQPRPDDGAPTAVHPAGHN